MQAQTGQQSWIGFAVPILILGLVMFRRIRSMGQLRPLKLETLWVVPTLYLVLAALMFWQIPPKGWVAIASIIALAIGAAVGWQRGTMMHIHVDPETHALTQRPRRRP